MVQLGTTLWKYQQTNMMWFGGFIAFVVILQQGLGAPISDDSDATKYFGMSKEEYEAVKACMIKLKAKLENCSEADIKDILIDDMVYTKKQCEIKLQHLEMTKSKQHDKRNAMNFDIFIGSKWTMPIKYHIKPGYFSAGEVANIQRAFQLWSQNTCLRFQEVSSINPDLRLDIYGAKSGCWSRLGKTGDQRQTINVQAGGCTGIGTVQHEIGHALGLLHEQARPDRDQYVTIHMNNIAPGKHGQFGKEDEPFFITHQVPYDYASTMHYGSKFFTKNGGFTITTKDPAYQHVIGQRGQASFLDYTMINRMYKCLQPGNAPLSCLSPGLTCKNSGYPNPGVPLVGTDWPCSSCLCPMGLKGDCSVAADGHQGCSPLSGSIDVTSTDEQCVMSPGYPSITYQVGQNCNWILKGPVGSKIMLRFDTSQGFGLLHSRNSQQCSHFVEIKYKGNLTETGPRYCGYLTPLNTEKEVTSTSNEVLVIFNSDYAYYVAYMMKGFKLCYRLDKLPATTSTQPTVSTTTPTTTTTTTTTTQANCKQTNPTANPAGSPTSAPTTLTMSTSTAPAKDGFMCYVCTGQRSASFCLGYLTFCPIDQYCYSESYWGSYFSFTKGCRPTCPLGYNYKARGLERYCCKGERCNENQSYSSQ